MLLIIYIVASAYSLVIAPLLLLTMDQDIASFGVFVGLATFVLVWRQIGIANKQVDIAECELKLVEQQGRILENQEADRRRRPDIVVTFEDGSTRFGPFAGAAPGITGLNTLLLPLAITNRGDEDAISYRFEVLLPWYGNADNSLSVRDDVGGNKWEGKGHMAYDLGNYNRWGKENNNPLLAGQRQELPVLVVQFPPLVLEWQIRWRVITDHHVFPQDGSWGLLVFDVTDRLG